MAVAAITGAAVTGYSLGSDAPESEITNSVENEFSQTIEHNISSAIDNSVNAFCENIQEAKNVHGCSITFGEQLCDASIMSSLTATNSLSSETMQDMYKETLQEAEFSNSQSGFKSFVDREKTSLSNFEKNKIDYIARVNLNLYTDCTRNLSNINRQTLENVTCGEQDEINFAAQTITSDVVADCAVDQAGSAKSAQYLTALSKQKATISKSGGYLWDLIILLLMIPLMLFLIPLAVRKGFTSFKKKKKVPAQVQAARAIIYLVLFAAAVWWPGLASHFLGIAPWPMNASYSDMGDGKGPPCRDGKLVRPNDMFTNKFMWWDDNCLIATQGGQQTAECDAVDRSIHYTECGLFNESNPCIDPAFIDTDRERYRRYLEACSKVDPSFVTYCSQYDIAQKVFKTKASDGVYEKTYGDSCTVCTASDSPFQGLYINSNADCLTADVQPLAYAALGKVTDKNGVVSQNQCEAGDTNCYDDVQALLAVSPDDCPNEGYQTRKRQLSIMLRQCTEINDAALKKSTPEAPVPLETQCSSRPQDFLDCNPDTSCNYVAPCCTYTGNGDQPDDPDQYDCSGCSENELLGAKACRNDFSTCEDSSYLKDLAAQDGYAEDCAAEFEKWQMLNPMAWIISLVAYVLLLGIAVLLIYKNRDSWVTDQDLPPRMAYLDSSGRAIGQPGLITRTIYQGSTKWYVFITLILAWMTAAVPFGMLGASYKMGIYAEENGKSILDGFDDFEQGGTTIIVAWALTILFSILLIAFIIGWFRAARSPVLREMFGPDEYYQYRPSRANNHPKFYPVGRAPPGLG
jgi:hypothetical protein